MRATDTGKRRQIRDPARTRRVIVEALLAALDDGEFSPTARNIADRAGVSERSVFVHFPDLDELRLAAAQYQVERVAALLEPIPADWPLDDRVDALLGQHERIFPLQVRIRLAALVHASTSPKLDARMREAEYAFRQHLAAVFATELDEGDSQLLDLLQPMIGWSFRYELVERRGLTHQQASLAVRRAVLAVLVTPAR